MKITRQLGKEMSVRNYKKRVVITGVGPVTPVGIGKEAYWESLIKGKSSVRRISFPDKDMSQYRCQIGAPIDGFDLSHFVERSKLSPQTYRSISSEGVGLLSNRRGLGSGCGGNGFDGTFP
jgi:hypothetical protein